MIASGVLLPLMDLVFGKFVTVFNNFIIGKITPAEFRSSLNDYTYVSSPLLFGADATSNTMLR